jgi:hypothetical protein
MVRRLLRVALTNVGQVYPSLCGPPQQGHPGAIGFELFNEYDAFCLGI